MKANYANKNALYGEHEIKSWCKYNLGKEAETYEKVIGCLKQGGKWEWANANAIIKKIDDNTIQVERLK